MTGWPLPGVDTTTPSVARGYDYALGGKAHFPADRAAMDALAERYPGVFDLARDNRAFLVRGVRYLVAEAGVRQFLDIGSGLPTVQNVHEVAHAIDPSVRVVYVDHDPMAVAHARALLADRRTTIAVAADAADPCSIVEHPDVRAMVRPDRPVGVLMAGVLHHLSDEQDPAGVTAAFRDWMPRGSHLLVSNFLDDDARAGGVGAVLRSAFGSGFVREWPEHRAYLDGLDLVEPGLVYAADWRPDRRNVGSSGRWHTALCAGIGRKP
ncbi:hypothetical protein BJF78_09315 [Pseudonocardia sp. CNS-139]|nr:hypothetical protein BJF78_09315 [Pseudonocardia sp. CNS-139]